MPKTIYLKAGDTADTVATKHFSTFSTADRDRLTKETADLIASGSLIAEQGGSFKSRRSVQLENRTVVLDARFGTLGLLDRLLLMVRR